MALKGILSAEDARLAAEHGVEVIVVSNHGGRQGDFMPSPLEVLPEIVAAVDGRAEVILDGGVRRGSDVVKAVALGARACMIGRPYLYGLGARGQAGAEQALDFLIDEIDRCLALNGVARVADLDRSLLRSAGPFRTD
jgi:L-lactate dehydrogenase (cytochrome)